MMEITFTGQDIILAILMLNVLVLDIITIVLLSQKK